MSNQHVHNIDFRKFFSIGDTGVRRAVLFMGLGLNAAHRDDFNDYQLNKLPQHPEQTQFAMDFFPDDLPLERVGEFKKEFATWIVACGMRELIEHYALMLDQIYINAMILLHAKKALPESFDPEKSIRRFERSGLPEKFVELERRLDLKIDGAACASELYEARNALTHDLGRVNAKRAPDGNLTVSWRAWNINAIGSVSGSTQPIINLLGKATPEEMRIEMSFVDRRKQFPVNSMVRFTQQDLWEICFFFRSVLIKSALDEFKKFTSAHDVVDLDAKA